MKPTKIFLLLLGMTSLAFVDGKAETTHEKTFANGMKVVVKEDHRAGVVTSQVWYRVGSAQEHSGITGLSHLLEHMMFMGTEKHPAGTFSSMLAEVGARDNAFTGRDYTAYHQLMGKNNLEISFALESDRMLNLVFSPDKFASELEVVKEERRLRTDDNPNALVYEQLYATAFINSPYHHPIIGWMNDLNHLTIEDLKQWYERWYAPNNATLVVAGDVQPQAVFALAEKYFAKLEKRPIKTNKPRIETPQTGTRRVTVRMVAELPYLMLGYKVPSLTTAEHDWEAYALAVLAGILDGGRSARLSKYLVRERELAASAGCSYYIYARYPTLFLFDATPTAAHSVADVEQALYAEIRNLQETLVSEKELARVKAQVIANEVYQQDSLRRQAIIIGILETVGLGWRVMDEYSARINAVTAEQVQQVVRKYLIEQGVTIALLEPLAKELQANAATTQRH